MLVHDISTITAQPAPCLISVNSRLEYCSDELVFGFFQANIRRFIAIVLMFQFVAI